MIRKILSFLLVALLLTPVWHQFTKAKWAPKLNGYQKAIEPVDMSIGSMSDMSWQQYAEEWIKKNLRLHDFLIRSNNQLKYSLFDILKPHGLVQGKGGRLDAGKRSLNRIWAPTILASRISMTPLPHCRSFVIR